ncbi:hypothetical protein GGR21_000006 [Dysgonomonas hofstadii]|uniref:Beta-lactamase-inhibitor-like PepSY-like domain-containing protein n=1 Tax=Dysgonomonas hofstadii TaxID=637886 RepID=A0A840CFY2_9BACT|nr:PepSY-like domain-containing protein [Dysgonomonas hofstadii]MBB4034121.1 hypothetical protein [Dysgonomonas hofstadii]
MKKLLLILCLLAGMIALSSCSDDNDKQPDLGFGDLPASSQEFLAQYFPDNKVVSVSFDFPISLIEKSTGGNTSQETIYIYALLEGNTSVAFSYNNGDWIEIFAQNGIPVSATKILDEYVYQKLTEKEPQAKITTLTAFYDHSIMIWLNNGNSYAQTELLAYSGKTLAEANITDNNVVTKVTDFLKRNHIGLNSNLLGRIFKITETEGTAYRLFMGNIVVISFDEDVAWIHAEINDYVDNSSIKSAETLLSTIAENEMPASISDAIKGQSNLGGIRIIAFYGDGNYGLRFKNKDLLVNENTGIVPPPVNAADKLMSDYYDIISYKHVYPDGLTLVGAYEYNSTFLYEGKDNDVTIEVDMDGNWIKINASYIENGKVVYISLPSEIVKELPVTTTNYLNNNYKDKEIYSLIHNSKGYTVYVEKKYMLYFNEDGSYRTMLEITQ